MSLGKLIAASLRYHWRTGLAVALAVMATSAVLTGALLVGESMRGSLRQLLLDQLGSIDEVLVTDRFFRAKLADEVERGPDFGKYFQRAVGLIFVRGSVERPLANGSLRAGQVTVIGCDDAFWTLGTGGPPKSPARNEVVINEPLAIEIGAVVGDEILLRIGSQSQIPPDSALGRKTETIRNQRLKVSAIIPAEGLGRFSLNPSQRLPRIAFVATQTVQYALEQPGRVNAIFVAGKSNASLTPAAHAALTDSLRPALVDLGIQVAINPLGYAQITNNRMLLDRSEVDSIESTCATDRPQPMFTYLANTIAAGEKEIPYSTITALDFQQRPPLGPFLSPERTPLAVLGADEIALNSWAANELGVKPGDAISIRFFEPESTHGEVRESQATFRLAAIVDLKGLAADPHLTPQLPGVTDRLSIGDWDAPFPFDSSRVRKVDEEYWDEYRTTPKAFVSLATGRRLWSSRFGDTTAVRLAPPAEATAESLAAQLKFDPPALGFKFQPIKQIGLAAASGTTPFDGLFLGFSLFIMVASLLLVALLFRLGVEQRAEQIGTLQTVGMRRRRIGWLLASEGAVIAAAGSLLGVAVGVGYAALMLAGLSTWWLAAISTPFLTLHVTTKSLAIGFVAGLLVSMGTIVWTLRRLGSVSVRRLLAGQAQAEPNWQDQRSGSLPNRIALVLLFIAAGLVLMAKQLSGEAQAGAFMGSGTMVLAAGLTWIWGRLRRGSTSSIATASTWSIAWLALRNAARNPSRSTTSVGLIAAASFLIVALSAFRLDPDALGTGPASGSGGYDLVAESDVPIYQDLNGAKGRSDLGFAEDDALLGKAIIAPFRVRAGDDASCLNLYQPTEPRMLGVTPAFIERGGFEWASTAAQTPGEQANPWLLLDQPLPQTLDRATAVPIVLDFNTAAYSLHKSAIGDSLEINDYQGRPLRLTIVGLLKNSIFQGDVLLSEKDFLKHFPQVNGYRFFLIDTRGGSRKDISRALEGTLGDFGFDVQTSSERLADFFAVQNTYLSTFQSLGGLGLLLGTLGLATVQLRNVLERRGELALMRAAGFGRWILAWLVMIENSLLLVAGLGVGVVAALVAILPYWLGGGASVPWTSLATTLLLVLVVGLLAGLLAVRAVLRAELLPALRKE